MKPEKTSGFRVLNVGFRVLFGYQFSGSGSKKVGFFPRVSGFRVPEPITRTNQSIQLMDIVARIY